MEYPGLYQPTMSQVNLRKTSQQLKPQELFFMKKLQAKLI